jgi:hypothetical protein
MKKFLLLSMIFFGVCCLNLSASPPPDKSPPALIQGSGDVLYAAGPGLATMTPEVMKLSGASIGIDSSKVMNTVNTISTIAQTLAPKPWIPGVANETVSGMASALAMLIIALVHRIQTIRSWRKSGKLADPPPLK